MADSTTDLVQGYRNTTVRTDEVMFFVECEDSEGTKKFHLATITSSSNTIDTGVSKDSVPDTTVQTPGTEVLSYANSQSIERYYSKDDPVCKMIYNLWENDVVGAGAHTRLIMLRRAENNAAILTDCVISVSSIPLDAQDKMKLNYTIDWCGDKTKGTGVLDKKTGICTFTEAEEPVG